MKAPNVITEFQLLIAQAEAQPPATWLDGLKVAGVLIGLMLLAIAALWIMSYFKDRADTENRRKKKARRKVVGDVQRRKRKKKAAIKSRRQNA